MLAAVERSWCGRRRVVRDNPLQLNAPRPHRKSREGRAMRMIDLSRELYHRTPTYPGQPPIIHGVWKTHEESFVESGNVHGNCVMFFSMPDHGGTHIDAPSHFGMSGIPIDEYPLEYCYVKGICLDLPPHPGQGRDHAVGSRAGGEEIRRRHPPA